MKKSTILRPLLTSFIIICMFLNSLNIQVYAQQDNEALNPKEQAPKEIYIKTGPEENGDGTQEHPYNNFKKAYEDATDNSTLVILNAVPIINDDNNSDTGVFSLSKNLTIKGVDDNSSFSSRVPLELKSNITIKDIELTAPELYLNGFKLELTNIKNNNNSTSEKNIYGGSHSSSKIHGSKSELIVNGLVNNPFIVNKISAGNKEGISSIPVNFTLNGGIKILDSINASGDKAHVNALVNSFISNASVNKFENTHNTEEANLVFKNHTNTNGPIINGYKNVKLEDSKLSPSTPTDFTQVREKLELSGKSTLDLRENTSPFTTNNFSSTEGSILILNKDSGRLNINNLFEGKIELKTPKYMTETTSGLVNLDQIYISSGLESTGKVIYNPQLSQANVIVEEKVTQNNKEWAFKKNIKNPIQKLELVESNIVNINETQKDQTFTLKALDKNDNPIDYIPIYDNIKLKNPNGTYVSQDNDVSAEYDPIEKKINILVYNNTLTPGTYVLEVEETETNKTFNINLEFYNDQEQLFYTVEFHANNGTDETSTQKLTLNESKKLEKNTFNKDGFIFKGWSDTKDGSIKYLDEAEVNNLTNKVNSKVSLYAIWEKTTPDTEPEKPQVDKSVLEEKIKEAEKVSTKGKTEESINALNKAIDDAKDVKEKDEATQEQVLDAIKNIDKAIEGLKDIVVPQPDPEVPAPQPDPEVPAPQPDPEVPAPQPDPEVPAPEPEKPTPSPNPSPLPRPDKPEKPEEVKKEVVRLAGENRHETAIEVSRKYFKTAETVIIARSDIYPDALSASMLSKVKKAPILLTPSDKLLEIVEKEIQRLGAKNVIIVGGDMAISKDVEKALGDYKVERLAGKDRFETSANIARKLAKENNIRGRAIIASGEVWADALAAGSFAGKENHPILLVRKDTMPEAVEKAIKDLGIKEVYIVGGSARISEKLKAQLPKIIKEFAGKDRFETARLLAEYGFKTSKKAYLASGESFVDSLIIGGVAGLEDAPILLTGQKVLDKKTKDYFDDSKIEKISIIGGQARISEEIKDKLK